MPRGNGGARVSAPGVAHPVRTDLNTAATTATQPVRVGVGQAYGVAAKQAAMQRAIPLPDVPTPTPPAGSPAAGPVAVPPAPPRPLPPALSDPTRRPDEPVTAGVPSGAGPGPEVLGQADPALAKLGALLPVLEIAASRPDATQDIRNFVRLVRANSVGV